SKSPVLTVKSGDKVSAAVKIMAEKNIGALLVMDGEKLVGIVSERDMVRKLLAEDKSPKDTPVSAVMTQSPYCADLEASIDSCIALMSKHRFRHLPVLDANKKLRGMVSMGDLVKTTIEDQAFMIDQFERYVSTGTY
ncbi:MAG TPA: inosine-5-monophosphate dehydrogenase, partial [Spirochaetaceae bacterium]|nr:inosine-5-monophosphate dehydrogenase [Spirochaetaceae bacterium]